MLVSARTCLEVLRRLAGNLRVGYNPLFSRKDLDIYAPWKIRAKSREGMWQVYEERPRRKTAKW